MELSLVMFKADGTRREFPVTRDRIVIGRKPTCDLRIPLLSVSRQHCEIKLNDGQVTVRDLGSSNGTFHNSERIQEQTLSPGDELTIGPVVFTVVIDGQPEHIEPVRSLVEDHAGKSGADSGMTGVTAASASSAPSGSDSESDSHSELAMDLEAADAEALEPQPEFGPSEDSGAYALADEEDEPASHGSAATSAQDFGLEDPDGAETDAGAEADLGDDSAAGGLATDGYDLDDPLAALERMAEAEAESESESEAGSSSDADAQIDDADELELFWDDDEEEPGKKDKGK